LKRFLIALVLSLILGFLGLYVVGGKALLEAETYRPQNLNILVVGVCVLALLAEWLLSAERIRLLCLGQDVALPYRSALLVNILSVLGGVIVPGSHSSAGPA
jgi:hypothetical protein